MVLALVPWVALVLFVVAVVLWVVSLEPGFVGFDEPRNG